LAYLTEPEPPRGVPLEVIPGVRRVVAANPGLMTYHGTNTFLIETEAGLVVLDPGPDDAAHLAAVGAAAAGAVAIVLSHGHYDHCQGAGRLAAALGAPVYGHASFDSRSAVIERPLAEGDTVAGLAVLHTPGHARDHICLARPDGVLFTGDQVMAWSSSVVPYPSGDMRAFIASLERLRDRGDRLALPGHGPALGDPAPFIDQLIRFRERRERAIVELLARGPASVDELTAALYAKRGPQLFLAARNNVQAHLAKLEADAAAVSRGEVWRIAASRMPTTPDIDLRPIPG
jgi:glyoxylase-like metal-dependent hydrolase (beta-lactamase superfamily II)